MAYEVHRSTYSVDLEVTTTVTVEVEATCASEAKDVAEKVATDAVSDDALDVRAEDLTATHAVEVGTDARCRKAGHRFDARSGECSVCGVYTTPLPLF